MSNNHLWYLVSNNLLHQIHNLYHLQHHHKIHLQLCHILNEKSTFCLLFYLEIFEKITWISCSKNWISSLLPDTCTIIAKPQSCIWTTAISCIKIANVIVILIIAYSITYFFSVDTIWKLNGWKKSSLSFDIWKSMNCLIVGTWQKWYSSWNMAYSW